ncbi:MAG TPA: hypothetical protein VJZ27_07440, partial [Aggregatilineales bacterium]|nr:hypothetical protein [Aggregatilineales bacterium]
HYYLGADPKVITLYFDTPDELVKYAQAELPEIPVPRYFVLFKNKAAPWIETLERHNILIESVYDDGRYVIYRLDLN